MLFRDPYCTSVPEKVQIEVQFKLFSPIHNLRHPKSSFFCKVQIQFTTSYESGPVVYHITTYTSSRDISRVWAPAIGLPHPGCDGEDDSLTTLCRIETDKSVPTEFDLENEISPCLNSESNMYRMLTWRR